MGKTKSVERLKCKRAMKELILGDVFSMFGVLHHGLSVNGS